MSAFDLHYNKDLSFFRQLIVGVLSRMSGLYWINQNGINAKDKTIINVPFYLSTTGSERYLNDMFLNNGDREQDSIKAESLYNQIPRGILELNSISIESDSITNKYIRTDHIIQEDDGTLNTYNSETFFIPLLISFNANVYVDSILDQLKATELIYKSFYKSLPFNFEYNYTMIPGYISFPEDVEEEHSVEFSFEDKKEYKISFSIEVKCTMPVYREEHIDQIGSNKNISENGRFFVGNRMNTIINNGYIPPITKDGSLVTNTGVYDSGATAYKNEIN